MGAMRSMVLSAVLALSASSPVLAAADLGPLNSAKNEISGVLGEIEMNLVEAEAIDMNAKDLLPKGNSIKARQVDYSQRTQQHNSYCQGTFEEPEYSRRKAYCDGDKSQLDALLAQLQPERQAFLDQAALLQKRDADRQKRGLALQERLKTGLVHLVTACIMLPLDVQKASCHLPPAPGPRTRPMVAAMESALTGQLAKLQAGARQ